MTHKPSKADVLKVAGEPVAWLWETAAETGIQRARPHPNLGVAVVPLYTESQLLAVYAAGAEGMRERIASLEVVINDFAQIERGVEEELTAEREVSDKLEKALKDTLSHLVAAASLLSHSPKTAAPSNKMFDQMVVDYKAAAKRSRTALAEVAALRKKDRE